MSLLRERLMEETAVATWPIIERANARTWLRYRERFEGGRNYIPQPQREQTLEEAFGPIGTVTVDA